MRQLFPFPVRLVYVIGLLLAGIFIIPIVWFGFHYVFGLLQPLSHRIAVDLGTNDTMYDQVDTFFQAVDNWIAVLALIALMVACLVYAHKRGQAL